MMFLPRTTKLVTRAGVLALCGFVLVGSLTAAIKRPIVKKPAYDPNAEAIDLFDGIDQGKFEATMIPKSSLEGNVFIENKTNKPLTVKLPKAVAAVQVLKQGFGGAGAGGAGAGGLAGGGLGGGQQGQGGQGQAMGGGMMGGMGGGMMGGGMGGMGMMSIPPEKAVQVSLKSVCLNHGKPEPKPQMTYKLVKLESYTQDAALQELLVAFGTGNIDQQAVQAATWHLTDKMSWQELMGKQVTFLGGVPPKPYFSQAQLMAAQQLVARAQAKAKERETAPPTEAPRAVPKL